MPSRSYLYVVDEVPREGVPLTRVCGLAEWKWDVPLVYGLLVSGSGRLAPPTIWDAPAVAILGDYDQGIANLERLLAQLPDGEETRRQVEEARHALSDPAKRGRYFLLEVAEIHVLGVINNDDPFPEVLTEAQGMLHGTEARVDSLIRYALDQPADKLDELTGYGSQANHLFFAPTGAPQQPPAVEPGFTTLVEPGFTTPAAHPGPHVILTRPLANGAVQWSLGLLALIPFPFVSAITAAIVMVATGRARSPATPAANAIAPTPQTGASPI